MKIRTKFSDYWGCNEFYLSRPVDKNRISVISWTLHSSLAFIDELDKFLDSACRHPQVGIKATKLIDYFDGKDPARLLEHNTLMKSDPEKYWSDPDINLGKVMVRFGKNLNSNTYVMLMHQSVKPDPSKNYVWHGPTFYLGMVAMEMMQEYLHWKHREAYFEPPSNPEEIEEGEAGEDDAMNTD